MSLVCRQRLFAYLYIYKEGPETIPLAQVRSVDPHTTYDSVRTFLLTPSHEGCLANR